MSAAWIAFAHTGNPRWHNAEPWPAHEAGSRVNMLFNLKSRAVKDIDKPAREFWSNL